MASPSADIPSAVPSEPTPLVAAPAAVSPPPPPPAAAPPAASSSTDAADAAPAAAGPSSAPMSAGSPVAAAAVTLSKSAMKKLAKQAAWEESKGARRQREKEKKQARKVAVLEQIAAGDVDLEASERQKAERLRAKNHLKNRFEWKKSPATGLPAPKSEADWFQARCVVDLGFDELMMEKEIKSMGSQLGYLWNIQRTAAKPFRSLVFTHLDQRLGQNLENAIWSKADGRWKTTEWWDGKDLDELWREAGSEAAAPAPDVKANVEADASRPLPAGLPEDAVSLVRALPSRSSADNVIYLTADSPNEVDALEEGATYVIGGIVDKNRYKSLCLDKAHKLGVRTARLPIGQYLADMPTRKVLTVNQVYEILTTWIETRDWETAFRRVIPLRKFTEGHAGAKKKQKLAHASADDGDEEATFLDPDEDASEGEDAQGGSEKPQEAKPTAVTAAERADTPAQATSASADVPMDDEEAALNL